MTVASREQQAEWFDTLPDADDVLIAYIRQHSEFLHDLARERLLGLGFDEYGDEMWRQSMPELRRELAEELADAINRVKALVRRMVGGPLSD